MKEPIQKYFQVGTIQWMTHPPVSYPVCDSVRAICCDPYFGALEITHIPDREERERVKRMLDQSHLRVCYGAQPSLLGKGLNPNHLEETQRRKAEEVLVEAVDEVYGGRGHRLFGGEVAAGLQGTGIFPAFKDNQSRVRPCRPKGHDGGAGGI